MLSQPRVVAPGLVSMLLEAPRNLRAEIPVPAQILNRILGSATLMGVGRLAEMGNEILEVMEENNAVSPTLFVSRRSVAHGAAVRKGQANGIFSSSASGVPIQSMDR